MRRLSDTFYWDVLEKYCPSVWLNFHPFVNNKMLVEFEWKLVARPGSTRMLIKVAGNNVGTIICKRGEMEQPIQ